MNITLAETKDVLQIVSYIVVLLGVFAGLFRYWRTTRREQLDREYGTYNALDDKYLEFLKLCLQRPYLDVFDIPDHDLGREAIPLTAEQKKEEFIAFTILISIFERAYLMYHDQSSKLRQRQWTGWDEYIKSYAGRGNFRSAYERCGSMFDTKFQEYLKEILREVTGDMIAPQGGLE